MCSETNRVIVEEWKPLNENGGALTLPHLLREEGKENSSPQKASHWVGADWSDQTPVIVRPKYDFLQPGRMLLDVLSSDIRLHWKHDNGILVSRTKANNGSILLRARPTGASLELPEDFPTKTFLPVQMVAFLNELTRLLDRRRRIGSEPVQKSYSAKIRGRLNISRSIQKHWGRGETHKVVCDIREPSINIPLNQVLQEALHRCANYLANLNDGNKAIAPIQHKLRQARTHLEGVDRLRDTGTRNLAMIRSSLRGYYSAYRPVFDLACCIIRNETFVVQPDSEGRNRSSMTVPFGVNMNLLFELYVRTACAKAGVQIDDFCRRAEPVQVWHHTEQSIPSRIPDVSGKLPKDGEDSGELPNDREDRRVVVEVKYYGSSDGDWFDKLSKNEQHPDAKDYSTPRGGFFQTCAYMQLFDAQVGIVVFPTGRGEESYRHKGSLGHHGQDGNQLSFIGVGTDYQNKLSGFLQECFS